MTVEEFIENGIASNAAELQQAARKLVETSAKRKLESGSRIDFDKLLASIENVRNRASNDIAYLDRVGSPRR